jgi:integrase
MQTGSKRQRKTGSDQGAALLTDKMLRALSPREQTYKVTDAGERGSGRLMVHVLPSGAKDFYYRYRDATTDRLVAIGRYDPTGKSGLTLAAAREKLKEHISTKRDHGDVKEHLRAEKRRKETEARRGTLGDLCLSYAANLEATGKVSARKVRLALQKHVQRAHPTLWQTHAANIAAADIRDILAKMVQSGCTRQVNILRAYLQAAFNWGAKSDHDPRALAANEKAFGLKGNPATLVLRVGEWDDRPGTRALSDEELAAYWRETETLPAAQRACLRFLLALGGQRATQLLRATWDAYDFDANVLYLRDTKGRGAARDHLIPMTPLALEQLALMRAVNAKAPGPFSSDGERTVLRVETLTNAVAAISVKLAAQQGYEPFRFGDLRRTCETTLARLGVTKDVRAWLLSHGRKSDVQTKHYDRNSYLPEKLTALEIWSAHLAALQRPPSKRGAKVIALRRK